MHPDQPPFLVTTRSHLRGAWSSPLMLAATRRIVRQLEDQPGARRWVSIVSSPREFWTVSAWSSVHRMQEFLRSGAHGRYMWEVGRWLDSFWLMRWRPTRHEVGTWDGLSLAPESLHEPSSTGLPPHLRARVLAEIPALREAMGPEGRPTRDAAPDVRHDRQLVAGAAGVLVRLATGPVGAPHARRHLDRLGGRLRRHDPELLRLATGRGQGGGALLLGVWRSRAGSGRLLDGDWMRRANERWGDRLWACELLPDNEFGHWDGLRLRDQGRDGALGRPQAATGSEP